MRKKIAVYIGEVGGTFQHTLMDVITPKANALGYDVLAFCSFGSYNFDILYAEGEKASIYLADPSTFDGIIVTEDLFDVPGMGDELYEKLKMEAKCPVVYLRTQRDGFYSILLENMVSIENMVRHFTDDHGFKDICYMSGKKGNLDAIERMQGFLNVMEEKGIPVTDNMIFHGDFWRDDGEEAIDWFMQGRDKYPEAIVCANDYMALSICDELRSRGVRVPEDVCVSGFDFIEEAKMYEPTLTSLEVDFVGMSERAIDIIHNVNCGIEEEYIQRLPAKLRLNKSCGCGEQQGLGDVAIIIEANYRKTASMKNIMLLGVEYQDCFTLDEYMAAADKFRYCIQADKNFFCLVDRNEEGANDIENDSSFTEQMVLHRVLEGKTDRTICHKEFPRRNLLPDEYWSEDKPNNYFFFTIHFKNIVHGYMVSANPTRDWFDIYTQSYLLNLGTAIENGLVHSRLEQLEEIRALYQKDALTGLYNRRGFEKLLREKFISSRISGEDFSIASIDMDNLKGINDTFGHDAGDNALKNIADALESVMEEGEFCARIGGDEFSAVLNPNRHLQFKQKFDNAIGERSQKIDDYDLGASVGICDINEDINSTLIGCIKVADTRMYEDKRTKKNHR